MAKDYYRVLGVPRDATAADIKAAFRRLARETHPDAQPNNPRAEARFREAAEAYEVLSDPTRRRHYDRGDPIDLSDLFGGFGGFEDILRSVFGEGSSFGGSSGTRSSRGSDLLIRTEISLEQAAFGCDLDVSYEADFACSACDGSGAMPHGIETCGTCGGSGSVRMARRSIVGTMMTVGSCPDCNGSGSRIFDPCPECSGRGVEYGEKTVTVEIPPGVSTGTRLRLSERGQSIGRFGRPGDLHMEVLVLDDDRFERHDADLLHRVRLGVVEVTLGTSTKVPLLEGGAEDLEIPSGTQPGAMFRLPGYGVPHLGGNGRGDLIVVVDVEIPTRLTSSQRSLLEQFEASDIESEVRPKDQTG